jgi:hypothetical protein
MRYRDGPVPPGGLEATASDDVLMLTYFIGLVVGLILTWVGWHGRQWWLVFWCGGLVLVSLATLGWELFH